MIHYPLYIENAGVETLYVDYSKSLRLELKPGERKRFCKENAIPNEETPALQGGDLYPAGMLIPDDEPDDNE